MKGEPSITHSHSRGWRLNWLLASFVILLVGGWLAREPITSYVEARVVRHLNENGVYPRYASRSWLPWRGLRLEGVTLYSNLDRKNPVIEVSALAVTFPWRNIWRTRELISEWHTRAATITLHDAAGAVTYKNVTAKVVLQPGEVDLPRLQFSEDAVSWNLSGKILVPAPNGPRKENGGTFSVDLGVARTVQTTLDIKPGTGPFLIQGNFSMDQQKAVPTWQAQLKGSGKNVVWHDVPLRELAVESQLSSTQVNLSAHLQLTKGAADLKASRADWGRSPMLISGSLADSAGRQDEVTASYGGTPSTLTLASVHGNADLLEFAHNFPALVPHLPTAIQVRTFPELSLTKLSYREGPSGPVWSLAAFDLRSAADFTVTVRGRALTVDQLTGRGAYDDGAWRLTDLSGGALGGKFTLSGAYLRGELREAKLELSNLRMKDLDAWADEKEASFGASRLSLDYQGTFTFTPTRLTGSGTIRLENAPVVKVPLLDETYALFSALEPRVRRTGTGNLTASFSVSRGVFTVSHLVAGGDAIDVTGSGTVDLVQRRVDGRAEGHLRGVPGLLTGSISKALEMKVTGPLDQIRVQPLSPLEIAGDALKGAVKLPEKLLKEGVTLPAKILDWFKGEPPPPKPN